MKTERKLRSSLGAKNLPASYFTSEKIFEEEWEKIFSRRWLCVGRESEIKKSGEFMQCRLEGESILIVRGQDGKLRAFYNHCRHRGTRLCDEKNGLLKENLQCPYHAWTYNFEAELTAAPNMAGVDGFAKTDYSLHRISLQLWEGFIFINFSDRAEPIQTAFAPVYHKFAQWKLPELLTAEGKSYRIRANWKLLFHNYSECYHCPSVHPLLNKITPYKDSSNDLEEGPFLGGPMTIKPKDGSLTTSGRACAPPLVANENQQKVFFYTLFPNLFLSLHPDFVVAHRLERRSEVETTIHCHWLFHSEAAENPDYRPQEAIQFWDMTNRQDWHVCELTHDGLRSRVAKPGPYANLESMLAAFDREYLRIMG